MVIPFLSIYLTKGLSFSLEQVGWIMSAFGLGSVIGAFVGGKLIKRIGYYYVMLFSLILSGIMFVMLQYIHSFELLVIGFLILMIVADAFRPASYVAINAYCIPENRTRSVTLIRLAINLGFSLGPALGGLIILVYSYNGLFWIDGITCVFAGIILLGYLKNKQHDTQSEGKQVIADKSPYTDAPFMLGIFGIFLIGFAFLQYFSTIPLYYSDYYQLSEKNIGWLMAMNGFLIFLLEMPIVKKIEKPDFKMYRVIIISTTILAFSFLILNWFNWVWILPVGMLLMTFGEMFCFPFLNTFALKRAEKGNSGEYMAVFTMAFSMAHILGHKAGMTSVNNWGYEVTWYIMSGVLIFAGVIFGILKLVLDKENS